MAKIQNKQDKSQVQSDNIQFQYYGTKVHEVTALGLTTLTKFLEDNISTENKILFDNIAQAESEGNFQLKAQLKQNNLRAFTPCVVVGKLQVNSKYKTNKPEIVGYKDYAHIEKFTGLMVLDFDHLSEYKINAAELKEYLYKTYDWIFAVWLSPSKDGIKCLVKIPIVTTVKEFQQYHEAMVTELANIDGLDGTTKNPTLSLFQSYDPDLLFRSDPSTWTKKAIKPLFTDVKRAIVKPVIDVSTRDRKTVLKIIRTGFNNISKTTGGHPKVVTLCISIGGYVGGGYLTELEAIEAVDYLIATHPYLQKDTANYQKTAHKFIEDGQSNPIKIEKSWKNQK